MARRLAPLVLLVAAGSAHAAGAQVVTTPALGAPACRVESVPYDSVRKSLLGSLRAIRFQDTAATRYDQVEARLDSLSAKLPAGFTYTRGNLAHGSYGVAGKRRQSVNTMIDAMPGMNGLLQRALNTTNLAPVLAAIEAAGAMNLLTARDDLYCLARAVRIDQGLEKLRMFERKFGPSSVKLNGLEVLVNYAVQLIPGQRLVGVDDAGWPRPWEVVVAYRTTYMTLTDITGDDKKYSPQAVTAAEFGLRHYNFGREWGADEGGVVQRFLKPGTWSLGLLVAPQTNGALRYPWRGDSRVGPYVAWGGLKVGYVTGKDRRLVVSREVMLIPYLF
ncbi:MAG: hypothetical protein MNPFHGCM_02506 [Gemmatimonadaceae bacterium]|nr:hypothetical protein [Gemmatimonadaceae bacterium]